MSIEFSPESLRQGKALAFSRVATAFQNGEAEDLDLAAQTVEDFVPNDDSLRAGLDSRIEAAAVKDEYTRTILSCMTRAFESLSGYTTHKGAQIDVDGMSAYAVESRAESSVFDNSTGLGAILKRVCYYDDEGTGVFSHYSVTDINGSRTHEIPSGVEEPDVLAVRRLPDEERNLISKLVKTASW